jgi:hypothetical protein
MNFKATALFLAVFAALAAYVLLVDEPRQVARQQAEERQGLVLPDLDPGAVTAVTVRSARGTVRVERAEGDAWRMTAPVADRGNAGRVDTLLADLGALAADREVADADADLVPFGLADPEVVVALEGPAVTLALGAENPAGDARYLRVGDGPVRVAKGDAVRSLRFGPDALRQPELLPDLPWGRLAAVAVRSGSGPDLRLEKEGKSWWLRRPRAMEADPEAVGRLTEKLRWARASGFPDPGERADAALGAGSAVTLEWEGDAPPVTVELVRADGAVWARRTGRAAVLAVPTDVWDAVQVDPESLRRRKPLPLKAWQVQGLEFTRGGEKRSYAKTDDGAWRRGGEGLGAAEGDALQALLRALEDTAADAVIDAPEGDAAYGLDAPYATVSVETEGGTRRGMVLGRVGGGLSARETGTLAPVYAMPPALGGSSCRNRL